MNRRRSGPLSLSGKSNTAITGLAFAATARQAAIVLDGCRNVTIADCDFDLNHQCQAVWCVNCLNIQVVRCKWRNIGHNFVQFDKCLGGRIADNLGVGCGAGTEDIVSLFRSSGINAAQPLVVENNRFWGIGWQSASGSGILLGDEGGNFCAARGNTLLNPGQVGIGIAGGIGHVVTGNTIYGDPLPNSNVGIYHENRSVGAFGMHEVSKNAIHWMRFNSLPNPYYNAERAAPRGEGTNNFAAHLVASQMQVVL